MDLPALKSHLRLPLEGTLRFWFSLFFFSFLFENENYSCMLVFTPLVPIRNHDFFSVNVYTENSTVLARGGGPPAFVTAQRSIVWMCHHLALTPGDGFGVGVGGRCSRLLQ